MTTQDLQSLKNEIQHIFDGGTNEVRIFEMVKTFIEIRGQALYIHDVSKSAFIWINRYSDNEEKDSQGRWARICYYKGKMIAWVSRVDHIEYGRYYRIADFFPSVKNDNPCLTIGMEIGKDFETIKQEVEQRFTEFLLAVC